MGVDQYVYLAVKSETMSSAQMAERIGLEPDEHVVRGARRTDPPVPDAHSWRLSCRSPKLRIDQQVDQVLDRLAPVSDNVRVLTHSGAATAVLQIVRFFSDTPSSPVPTTILVGEDGAFEGPMPHYLLGWSLSAERLALLSSIGASIDCDEHDG